MTKVAQRLLGCNNRKQVIDLVSSEAKAALREWKRGLIQEAVEGLIDRFHGQKWLKIRKVIPAS